MSSEEKNEGDVDSVLRNVREKLMSKTRLIKKKNEAIFDAMCFLLCPLSGEPPSAPVAAEDGCIYERDSILSYFDECEAKDRAVTSPITSAKMGTKLIPMPSVFCAVECLIGSGAFGKKEARRWEQRMRINMDRDSARKGSSLAMKRCGEKHLCGKRKHLMKLDKSDQLAAFWSARADIALEGASGTSKDGESTDEGKKEGEEASEGRG